VRGRRVAGGPVVSIPLRGDEESLFAEDQAAYAVAWAVGQHLGRKRRRGLSFAWMQLLRRQPMRETVLSWLTTVADPGAVRLDRRDRRDERLPSNDGLPSRSESLTHAGAFAALDVVGHCRRDSAS
jgi:hypothetical protein